GALLVLGVLVAILGMVADLVAANRKLMEENLVRTRKLEDLLGAMLRDRNAGQSPSVSSQQKDAA
ncbi:MAG: hypothetical protein WA957_10785, partial [Alteraurantiacibacter sp.]